ncbi:MAG: M48 family peptidase [Bryobacteraceae bacterium]|nr:M48 family peptidase [Bryobacteraceae bacterium]MCX7603506.1 M48 family peptidase [Bryobacteraceae bacterium]
MQLLASELLPQPESTEAIFQRVYSAVARTGEAPPVRLHVRPYVATIGRLRLAQGVLELRLSEAMAAAPATVREALAWILVSRLFRSAPPAHWVRHYRQYMNRKDVRRVHQAVRAARSRKHISGPQGVVYDLAEIFRSLRDRYFGPLLPEPQLGWSRRPSRTLLGHFDHVHNAIVLSSWLDRPEVPRFVVEYVMYHEMLHMKHPVEHRRHRRSIHPPAFREEEKRFERLAEARSWLKTAR